MFLSFSFAVLMAVVPPEMDRIVGDFVEGLRRHDHIAIRGRRPLPNSYGTSYDHLRLHADVDIESWRIVSTEPAEGGMYLNVEMEGMATAEYTGERVRWPRRWSIQVVQLDGEWVLDTAMMTERRLIERHGPGGAPELSRALAQDPALDFSAFMLFVAQGEPLDTGRACSTFLWMLREGEARGEPAVQALAYQMLSTLALEAPPVDPAEALAMAEQSLRYSEASADAGPIAWAYFDIGLAHAAAGRIDEAAAALRHAGTYYGRAVDPRGAKGAVYEVIELELERNNLRAALADAELFRTMLGRFSSRMDHRNAVFRVGEIHERLGNTEIALRHYQDAREHAQAEQSPEWQITTAWKIALQEKALGNVDHARGILEDVRQLYEYIEEPEPLVLNQTTLAAMELDRGETAASEKALEEALAVIAAKTVLPKNVAEVYLQRSRLRLVQGRPEEALADARRASENAGSSRFEALTAQARALRRLSRNADAEEVLRAAIDLVEVELAQLPVDESGSGTVVIAKLAPYRELLDLLVEQDCAREALTVAEWMRARSLREMIEHGPVDLSAGLDAAQRERERALEQALVDANRKLLAAGVTGDKVRLQQERDEARLELRRFRSELSAAHPHLDRRRPEAASQGELLRPMIPAGELVLELAVLDHSLVVFALREGEVAVSRVAVSRETLEREIAAFVTALEQRDLGYTEYARALHDRLLGPFADQLRTATSLRIVPDGAAWRLPFHALVDGRGTHLVERMPVAYSPSLAMARTAAARPETPRTLLAFGDPAVRMETERATRSFFRDVPLARLPEAAEEARAIARLYRDSNVRTGVDAREAAFKDDAPGYRVLHLAAHSLIDDRAPMFSSIVLSASGNNPLEDGLLEAREIAGLDLRADLAVLSACETARGAVTAGEGMVGLSWAFLAAGVPTTVVSQWKVASASTAELMIDFHRRLRDGRQASEALRAAMLELRRDPRWRHPFYWAPFAVIENSGIPSKR
jgi:CHAT domain-containing protein